MPCVVGEFLRVTHPQRLRLNSLTDMPIEMTCSRKLDRYSYFVQATLLETGDANCQQLGAVAD
jgi:hypothetical protein